MKTKMKEILLTAVAIKNLPGETVAERAEKKHRLRSLFERIDVIQREIFESGDRDVNYTRDKSVDHIRCFCRNVFTASSQNDGGFNLIVKAVAGGVQLSVPTSATKTPIPNNPCKTRVI